MNENWQNIIESFSEKEIFNYLTIDRGIYQKEAIDYAEKILKNKKITLIELQKKYNYDQKSIETEIIKRINSEENKQKIEQDFIDRKLEKYIYLIQEKNTSIKKEKRRKKRKYKIIFNTVLSILYSFIFLLKNTGSSVNVFQFLIALVIPFLTPFIFGIIIELFKVIFSKKHKFELFSDLFIKTWIYFILFLYFTLILSSIS